MQQITLSELIAKARAECKWLWCHDVDLWFSPDELQTENAAGRYRWPARCWLLRDPKERLEDTGSKIAAVMAEHERIAGG